MKTQLLRDGFATIGSVLTADECDAAARAAAVIQHSPRRMLDQPWCVELAGQLACHPQLAPLIGADSVAVQCTYFEKSAGRNWLVPIHQDLSIPVAERIDHPALAGWSIKEGCWFVRPPSDVLERMLAVRVHLDDCGVDDGPLRVVSGSHLFGQLGDAAAIAARSNAGETVCLAPQGSVLAMRPLLLHASSKGHGTGRRRVLHFVFGPRTLPLGLAWAPTSGGTDPRNCG